MRNRAATMKDVATEAGVAIGTVSKVINGIPVGREYQRRVEAAIRKLDYRVNGYAKGLRAGKSNTIALLIPDTCDPFYGAAAYYIHRALMRQGYRMLLCATDSDADTERELMAAAQANRVDGMICYSNHQELQVPEGIPFVSVDRQLDSAVPCVASDNFSGGRLAAKKLIESGCRRLAFISTGSAVPGEPDKRGDGFMSCCAMEKLPCESLKLTDGEPFTRAAEFLDRRLPELDGIFCSTDALAQRVMEHLRKKGVRVPEDVQLMGYDGIRNTATGRYACSTVIQPVEQIAETAVSIVLSDDWTRRPSLICMPVSYGMGGTLLTDVKQ